MNRNEQVAPQRIHLSTAKNTARIGHAGELPLSQQLLWMTQGYILSQVVHVIAKLSIADHLIHGPQTSQALAQATETDPDALHRLLLAGAAFGLLEEVEPHGFTLTRLGELLRSDVPGSVRDYAVAMVAPEHWLPCGRLEQAIRSGKSPFQEVFGVDLWEYHAQHTEEGIDYAKMLANVSALMVEDVVARYDVTPFQKIVDVGANAGRLLASLLYAAPAARGVLFDLPHMIAEARVVLEKLAVRDRIELIAGDFFQAVPADGDLYILMRILHLWDDGRCTAILRNIHRASKPRSKLLIIERLLPVRPEPSPVYLSDLNMLIRVGGRERSRKNFHTLLESAGYTIDQIIPISGFFHMIEAVRG
jgi:ubiquinone/menaquinone biosynthesis C-methylase UbiE